MQVINLRIADNVTIQEFHNLFIYTMNGILKQVYDQLGMYILLVRANISVIIYILFLKKWLNIRVNNKKFLEIIQTLQASNERQTERIHTIENEKHNLTDKIHFITIGYESLQNATERLPERIQTVEINNHRLLKTYDKIVDRTSLLQCNLHAIHIISKDKKISLMEKI